MDIVYVVGGHTAKSDVIHSANKFEIEQKRNDKIKVVKQIVIDVNIECRTHILHGDPGPATVEIANDYDFDCVVVGS